MPLDSVVSLWGTYPFEIKASICKDLYTRKFVIALFSFAKKEKKKQGKNKRESTEKKKSWIFSYSKILC